MSLTLIQQPEDIVLARNQVLFKLRATAPGGGTYAAKGASATLTGAATGRFSIGATLTVNMTPPGGMLTSIVFTAAVDYTGDNALPTTTFAGTSADYWAAVQGKVAGHPQLGAAVVVSLAYATTIILTVRLVDVRPTGAVTLSNSAGFTVAAIAATTDTTPDNYRVLLEVHAQKGYRSGAWVVAAQAQGLPDVDGYLYFDIGPALAAHCRAWRSEPVVPVFGTAAPVLADNLRRYQVRYTEESGVPPTLAAWTVLAAKYCIDGGVSDSLAAGGNSFLSTLNEDNSLLSWMPPGRSIGLDQPEYLPWYNYTGADATVVLQAITYDVDNGNPAGPLYYYEGDIVPVKAGETLLIPLRSALMGAAAAADKYKMAVRVVDATSAYDSGSPVYLSQARTYYLDRDYYDSQRYVQYLNGFGCPECWRCTGVFNEKLKVARSVAARNLGPGYNEFAVDSFQYEAKGTPTLTYRTGYMRKSDAQVLKEMLLAPGLYDVSANGYIALQMTGTDFEVTETRQALHAYAFAAQPRLGERIFSKTAVTAVDANVWQEPDNSSWFDSILQPWEQ